MTVADRRDADDLQSIVDPREACTPWLNRFCCTRRPGLKLGRRVALARHLAWLGPTSARRWACRAHPDQDGHGPEPEESEYDLRMADLRSREVLPPWGGRTLNGALIG